MKSHIIKIPGAYEEIIIHCPKCNSHDVTISLDVKGYYEVMECYNCRYKKSDELF